MDENKENIGLKDIIVLLMEKLDAQMGYTRSIQERLDRIEKGVVEGLLNPLSEAQDEFEFNDWKETYGAPLKRFEGATRAIEGDDFDVYREAYNQGRALDDDSQGDFVDNLVKSLEEQISNLRNGLDLPPDTDVEIKSDSDGNVEVKVNDETIGNSNSGVNADDIVTESPIVAEKSAENEVAKNFNEKMKNPESADEDMELEKISNKYKNSKWR